MSLSVISIQSQVVHGHVGNSAAVFPMQANGLTVAAVPTVLLSNNPHYETMRGRVLESSLVGDLLLGIEERGLVETSRYIVSGYLGSAENGAVIADFVQRARQRNPYIEYICDPVMGDVHSGTFVPDPVADFIVSYLAPRADILTPNLFEMSLLCSGPAKDFDGLQTAVAKMPLRAGARVVVTSCLFPDTPENSLENVVLEPTGSTRLLSPRLPIVPAGTGDLFTGLLTASLSAGSDLALSTSRAADIVTSVLRRTIAAGTQEMQMTLKDLQFKGGNARRSQLQSQLG